MMAPPSPNTSFCPSLPHSLLLLAGSTLPHPTSQALFLNVSFLRTLHPGYRMYTLPGLWSGPHVARNFTD